MTDYLSRTVMLSSISGDNSRIVLGLWDRVRTGRMAPDWTEFELNELPAHVIRYIRVADVVEDGRDFVFRFFGTGLADVLGREWTGHRLSDTSSQLVKPTTQRYHLMLESAAPQYFVVEALGPDIFVPLEAEGLRLPFSSDGEGVDKILTYVDYSGDHRRWQVFYEQNPKPA